MTHPITSKLWVFPAAFITEILFCRCNPDDRCSPSQDTRTRTGAIAPLTQKTRLVSAIAPVLSLSYFRLSAFSNY
ncbi:MAG TPA: hypothetical protein VK211_07165 [Kamptonema sp.]|nr:hypothetical protein [Kamptonema sp.]